MFNNTGRGKTKTNNKHENDFSHLIHGQTTLALIYTAPEHHVVLYAVCTLHFVLYTV